MSLSILSGWWTIEGGRFFADELGDFSASSLGMMSDEEKKMQRIEDIRELLS